MQTTTIVSERTPTTQAATTKTCCDKTKQALETKCRLIVIEATGSDTLHEFKPKFMLYHEVCEEARCVCGRLFQRYFCY